MTITKNRLEAFIDAVIAIVITIMVLEIPLPESFETKDLFKFGTSLLIYLLSFLVVGAFWNQHHQLFQYLERVNQRIIISNIFFLFFLSLIPLFTKWVIENQGVLTPVIGFDIIYFLASLFYMVTFRAVVQNSDHDELKQLSEHVKRKPRLKPKSSWLPLLMLLGIIGVVIFVSIYFPKVATYVLMGIPITSSIVNLFIPRLERGHRKNQARSNQPH